MTGIYKFTNKFDRKVYIGKALDIEKRRISHFKPSALKKKCIFNNAIKKYGIDGFDFEVVHECPIDQLNYWEKFYIKFYCSNNPNYGYNMTAGGDGLSKGNIPWNKGKHGVYSDDVRKSMGADKVGKPSPRRGVNLSDKTKQLISNNCKGKKDSDETRRKKSIAKSGKNNPCYGKHRVYDNPEHTKYHYE